MLSGISGPKENSYMRRSNCTMMLALALLILSIAASTSLLTAAQGRQVGALAPKPAQLTPYTAPHKPHWKLSDVVAQNAGKQSWSVTVVDDALLKAQYISM